MMNSLQAYIAENKAIQDKIIDVVADYDVEFAAELDDLVEHKIKANQLELNRLKIELYKKYNSMTDVFMLLLDHKPIAEYWIDSNLKDLKAEIHFEKL